MHMHTRREGRTHISASEKLRVTLLALFTRHVCSKVRVKETKIKRDIAKGSRRTYIHDGSPRLYLLITASFTRSKHFPPAAFSLTSAFSRQIFCSVSTVRLHTAAAHRFAFVNLSSLGRPYGAIIRGVLYIFRRTKVLYNDVSRGFFFSSRAKRLFLSARDFTSESRIPWGG